MNFLKANWKSAFFGAFIAILFEEIWRWLKEVVWTIDWSKSTKIIDVLKDSGGQAAIFGMLAPIVVVVLYFRRYKLDFMRPNQFTDLVFLSIAITYFLVFIVAIIFGNTDGLLRDLSSDPLSKVFLFGYLVIRLSGEVLEAFRTGNGAPRR